jgi:hypothetical protein
MGPDTVKRAPKQEETLSSVTANIIKILEGVEDRTNTITEKLFGEGSVVAMTEPESNLESILTFLSDKLESILRTLDGIKDRL